MALPPNKKAELNFQPITEGLGFHPFSDGLPYAPVGKTQTKSQASSRPTPQSGSGAVTAGIPQFAKTLPRPAAARISVPVARSSYIPQRPTATTTPSAAAKTAAAEVASQLQSKSFAENLEPAFGYGYVVKRIMAYLLDSLFNLGLCAGALSAALWKQDLSPELLLNPGIVLVAVLFLAVFNWAITTAQEVAFSTSIGKRMFGLALNGTTSAIFLRAFFFVPSACFGGIGLVWALFDRRKRCWHDLVVDLQPIEITKL